MAFDFAAVIANAKSTQRTQWVNEQTVNNCIISGIEIADTRKQGETMFVHLYVEASTAKIDGATAHKPGVVVGDSCPLKTDWGPGKAISIVAAAVGFDAKGADPAQVGQLIATMIKKSDIAPNGTNAARGLRVRVETMPYKNKEGKAGSITKYTHIPTTPEEVAANRKMLDAAGVA